MSVWLLFAVSACPFASITAEDAPGGKGQWTVISDKLVADAGAATDKFDQTAGIAVDRTTGAVFVALNSGCGGGIGRSSDQGRTFERIDDGKIKGRCETGWAINVDPNNGKRIACFEMGGMGGVTLDGGKTWTQFQFYDYGAVDWSAADPKVMLASAHESGGKIALTKDAGKTWNVITSGAELRSGSSVGIGVVDAGTLLLHRQDKSGIERSTDDGATWTQVSDCNPASRVAVVFKGAVYWVGAEGLIVSKDAGKTWQVQGTAVDAIMGPFFGKTEDRIVVVGRSGFSETTDGGKTWKNVLPLTSLETQLDPQGYGGNKCGITWFDHFAWDPVGDIFYHSKLREPARKYER
jgi:hypothetical protein